MISSAELSWLEGIHQQRVDAWNTLMKNGGANFLPNESCIVLALIERLRAAERERDGLRALAYHGKADRNSIIEQCASLCKGRASLGIHRMYTAGCMDCAAALLALRPPPNGAVAE